MDNFSKRENQRYKVYTRIPDETLIKIAVTMVEEHLSTRQLAKIFGYGKSSIHRGLREKLIYLDPSLYEEVDKQFAENKARVGEIGAEVLRRYNAERRRKKAVEKVKEQRKRYYRKHQHKSL